MSTSMVYCDIISTLMMWALYTGSKQQCARSFKLQLQDILYMLFLKARKCAIINIYHSYKLLINFKVNEKMKMTSINHCCSVQI